MAVARERRAQLGARHEPAPKFATGRAASTRQGGAGGYGDAGEEADVRSGGGAVMGSAEHAG